MGGKTKRLKRQLDGNPEQRSRHDPFVLFLDETTHNCKPILAVLGQMGIEYKQHGSLFSAGTLDEVWLSRVGENRWAFLTCDKRIRYNQLEIDKIVQFRIREFVFTSGDLSGPMMAAALEKAMPRMKRLFKKHEPPFIATLSQSGNVEIRYDKDGSIYARKKEAAKLKTGKDSPSFQ